MREGDYRRTAWLQMAVLVPANLIGALVSFTYFVFVDRLAPPHTYELAGAVRFFVVGFALLAGIVSIWSDRWSRVLNPVDGRRSTWRRGSRASTRNSAPTS